MKKKRCSWCMKDKLYMDYHDDVWGVPVYDDQKLFEYINLEGAQAGLSWYTILKRIETYRTAFAHWEAKEIVNFSEKDKLKLMGNPGIIRNKLKIEAVIQNARVFLELKEKETFANYLWSFVDGKQIINNWKEMNEIPASTPLSEKMSKDLKQKGFRFVGPTIVYAFMQAVGIVDDHVISCWKRNK